MKKAFFSFLVLGLVGVIGASFFASCSDDDDDSSMTVTSMLVGEKLQEVKKEETSTNPTAAKISSATTWDLTGKNTKAQTALPSSSYNGKTVVASPIVIAADSGSGATFTILANADNKPKISLDSTNTTSTGIQQNTGTKMWDFATVHVDGACTITVTYKPAGDGAAGKVRGIEFGGNSWTMGDAEKSATVGTKTITATATGAGDFTIKAGGLKFTKVECK